MKRLAALAALKLSLFLKGRVDDDFFKRYSRFIAPDVTEEELAECPVTAEELFEDEAMLAVRARQLFDLCACGQREDLLGLKFMDATSLSYSGALSTVIIAMVGSSSE